MQTRFEPNTTYLLFLNTDTIRARFASMHTRRNEHIGKGSVRGLVHDPDWDDVVEVIISGNCRPGQSLGQPLFELSRLLLSTCTGKLGYSQACSFLTNSFRTRTQLGF